MPKLMGLFKISTAMCVINLHIFYTQGHQDSDRRIILKELDRDGLEDGFLTTFQVRLTLPQYVCELVRMFEDRQEFFYPVGCGIQ